MSNYYQARGSQINTFRSTSSSLLTAPSWSLGIGANESLLRANGYLSDDDEKETAPARNDSSNNLNGISTASGCGQNDGLDQVDGQTSLISRPYIYNIEIPTVFLKRHDSNNSSYHVYQIRISSKTGEQWSIYRRYSQFHSLHHELKSLDTRIKKIKFPPKRRINSKASNIVQDRQLKLESYMIQLKDYVQRLPLSNDGDQDTQTTRSRSIQADAGCQPATSSRASISTSDSVTCDGEDNSSSDTDLNQLLSERSSSLGDQDEPEPVELAQLALPDAEIEDAQPPPAGVESPAKIKKSSVRSIFYEFICFDSKQSEELKACDLQNCTTSGSSDELGVGTGSSDANQTLVNESDDL